MTLPTADDCREAAKRDPDGDRALCLPALADALDAGAVRWPGAARTCGTCRHAEPDGCALSPYKPIADWRRECWDRSAEAVRAGSRACPGHAPR